MFKGTLTKHRTAQKHVEHQDATDIQNIKLFFVFKPRTKIDQENQITPITI